MILQNKDQFGFYTVGDFKTYSKIEALEVGHRLNIDPQWNFNEEVFGKFDWKFDSGLDINDVYAKRALDIRNKYDYVVIWYSGGADSFNILDTFRRNNIHVDEIAQFHAYEGEKSWNSFLNAEVDRVAVPMTKQFLDSMPNTKHRMVDVTELVNEVYKMEDNRFDFIYKSNRSLSPHQLARTYFREKIKDYTDIIESGKKLVFVWGGDKPPVRYDEVENKYYLQFNDSVDSNGVGPRTQQVNRPWEHDEMFYWSPDCPDLIARQAHIVVNYLRNPPLADIESRWLTSDPNELRVAWDGTQQPVFVERPYTVVNGKKFYLTVDGMHRLLYTTWDNNTFSLGKSISMMFGPRDAWWFRNKLGTDQKNFYSAVISMRQNLGRQLFRMPTDMGYENSNFKLLYSKKYYLD